jgi:predicted Fe-Mo cluster-binding NifX family protein
MKIVFTTKGTKWDSRMDPRFGRTEYLLLYDEEADTITSVDNREIENEAHGAGPHTVQKLLKLKPDVLITGNGPGGNAAALLERRDIIIYIGAGDMSVKEAYKSFKNSNLKAI